MERSRRALHVGHDNEVEAELLHQAHAFTRDTSHGTIQLRLGHEHPFVQRGTWLQNLSPCCVQTIESEKRRSVDLA